MISKEKSNLVGRGINVYDTILTVEQAAEILNLTNRTVGDLLRAGRLVGYKKNRQWYLLYSDLIAYIKTK
jgi:excisionase family DNA binding protein